MMTITSSRSLFSAALALVLFLLLIAQSNQTQQSSLLRTLSTTSSSTTTTTTQWERMHYIRRIYDNIAVRRQVDALHERMPRYQTGLPADPSHIVPYKNHPFAKQQQRRQRRRLDDNEDTVTTTTTTTEQQEDAFQPIRMVFITTALDEMRNTDNAAKIDWYVNQILPATAKFWSQALSVIPVNGRLRISSAELDGFTYCGDSEFTAVPNEHKSDGLANADLVLYVSGSSSTRFCPDRTLAVAVPCNFDQFDRPTAGAVNVCLDNIVLNADGTASDDVFQDYIDVTIHEVGHVLGHSSNSYRFFWDPETGEPRTARPFSARTVTCVDGTERSLILPDENTMVFAEENGVRFASIVTPKVRQVARNQFDCQSLEGARLENQPTRPESCTGDHWDERLFYPEAMSGVISPTANIFSSLTLAFMEDSGWYKANYTQSRMSPWGLGMGCEFVNSPCVINGEVPEYGRGFFCNDSSDKGCSSEHTHKQECQLLDYSYVVGGTGPEQPFLYFASESKGGPRQADYCPVYGSSYDNIKAGGLNCKDTSNAPTFNIYSEVYGDDSLCIRSSAGEGLCYKTACVQEDMSVRINVIGEWIVCEYDFQEHSVRVGQGLLETTLTCPRLSQACPELFCPFNCAGRGVCNYANTVNGTIMPKCECFDSEDTSAACSDSLIPDGGFLKDSSGLFDNLEENFFDPLVAVFVDHPDAWTSASWGWAGGLIAVFLILLLCICSSFFPSRQGGKRY